MICMSLEPQATPPRRRSTPQKVIAQKPPQEQGPTPRLLKPKLPTLRSHFSWSRSAAKTLQHQADTPPRETIATELPCTRRIINQSLRRAITVTLHNAPPLLQAIKNARNNV